ncbi:hypothetical protein STCU_06250 [Strigomonas culicis]|nr:hypothetical protein STCU_06250 [Strigomonas culicis]|eukprot:EPY26241.1 hypothetical protein STCU_06250 [Strigomonas culicis]
MANGRTTERDWRGAAESVRQALAQDAAVMRQPQTGLYLPHHHMLADFVERAATVLPRHHDSAQLLQEAVSPHVLREKMRTVSEVHFNALASIRWEQCGGRVVPGDLVATSRTVNWDPYEGSADHMHGFLGSDAHPNWLDFSDNIGYLRNCGDKHITLIKDEGEAAQYTIQDVVLPFYGRAVEELPALPAHSAGALFETLAKELQVSGAAHMRTAARAGYRRLVVTPPAASLGFYLVDEGRQWEWEEGALGAALKAKTYKDQEGVLRLRSPFAELTRKNMIARRGIRGERERHSFLKPARGTGLTFCMEVVLPRGTPITSAVREVFRFATLSPKAVYHLLKR